MLRRLRTLPAVADPRRLRLRPGVEDGSPSRTGSAGAFAVAAPRPAARPTLAFLKLLLGSANAAFSGHLLLGILDPADELVAGQRRYVVPGIERRRVGDQSFAQVFRKFVHHPTGHSLAAHKTTVAALLDAREASRLARPSSPSLAARSPFSLEWHALRGGDQGQITGSAPASGIGTDRSRSSVFWTT